MGSRRRLAAAAVLAAIGLAATGAQPAVAATGPIVVAGDFQSELGCPGDWSPDCLISELRDSDGDGVATASLPVPAGSWSAKVAVGATWDENYGLHGRPGGANIPFTATGDATAFAFDTRTHYPAIGNGIVVAAGSFQSELGCPGDWSPDCLRSWLQDADGNGVAALTTADLPVGAYETKVALGTTWDRNYGRLGKVGGANIAFTVKRPGDRVTLLYAMKAHLPTVVVTPAGRCAADRMLVLGRCVRIP